MLTDKRSRPGRSAADAAAARRGAQAATSRRERIRAGRLSAPAHAPLCGYSVLNARATPIGAESDHDDRYSRYYRSRDPPKIALLTADSLLLVDCYSHCSSPLAHGACRPGCAPYLSLSTILSSIYWLWLWCFCPVCTVVHHSSFDTPACACLQIVATITVVRAS